jgi:hypothetical protein
MVKKCYIERLIYNEIYKHFIHEQNFSHVRELKYVSEYYYKYFPNESISVKIKYNKKFYPYKLIVNEIKNEGFIEEIYTKNWEYNYVICQLMIKIYNKKYFFSKINSYYQEEFWKPIKINTVNFGKMN